MIRTRHSARLAGALAAALLTAASASAAPLSIDGAIGAEWAGATVKTATFNAAAPTSNFGTPTGETNNVAYDIYTRTDGAYVYAAVKSAGGTGGQDYANLYFDTNPSTGSDLGFEVTNERAFIPGVPGYFPYTPASQDIHYAMTTGATTTIEFAMPISFVTGDPLAMGFPLSTTDVQLRLSQSLGLSVIGGATMGSDRLGQVAIPEPAGLSIAAGAGLLALRRARRR